MKRILAVFVGLYIASPVAQADLSANVGVTSNYVFRGLTQTNNDPAVQGGIDYTHESGFYAGAWASQVNMPRGGRNGHDVTGLEVDGYLGLSNELQGGGRFDLGAIQYSYTDVDKRDVRELYFGLGFGPFSGTFYWGDDSNLSDSRYQYLDLKYTTDIGDEVGLTLHYGHYNASGTADDYNDVSASLKKTILGAEVSATITAEDHRNSKHEKLFMTITKTFDLQ